MDFFDELCVKNVQRCQAPAAHQSEAAGDDYTGPIGFGHALSGWSIAEWTNALCGEAGEAANIAKKLIRQRDNIPGNKGATNFALRAMLAKELADVLHYAVLTAAAAGIDLRATAIEVFNAKSDEIGSNIKLMERATTSYTSTDACKE